jgi:hypothetical protein
MKGEGAIKTPNFPYCVHTLRVLVTITAGWRKFLTMMEVKECKDELVEWVSIWEGLKITEAYI